MTDFKDIKPVYVFYGAERFLLQAALQELIAEVAPGDNPFNLTRLNAENASLAEILTHANTLPFFTQYKLVIVENSPWFANRKKGAEAEEEAATAAQDTGADAETLLAYLQNPTETTVLVFLAGESINKAKKLSKAAAKCGQVREFAPLKGNNALVWLDGLLRQKGCRMAAAAKQQLLLYCGYNCTLINNELEKLCLYAAGQPEISRADVEAVVSSNATASIFNLIDYVAGGQLAEALRALEQVTLSEQPEGVLPRLADHFQMLYIVKGMQQQGYTVQEIMAACGKSHPFVIEKAGRQAARYTERKLQRAMETLLMADRKNKNGVSDIMDAIETAIIQICLLSR